MAEKYLIFGTAYPLFCERCGEYLNPCTLHICKDILATLPTFPASAQPSVQPTLPCPQCGNVGVINRNGIDQCDTCGYPARG